MGKHERAQIAFRNEPLLWDINSLLMILNSKPWQALCTYRTSEYFMAYTHIRYNNCWQLFAQPIQILLFWSRSISMYACIETMLDSYTAYLKLWFIFSNTHENSLSWANRVLSSYRISQLISIISWCYTSISRRNVLGNIFLEYAMYKCTHMLQNEHG